MSAGLLAMLAGAALLYVGATLLIRGASGLARSLGVAPAVVGLTVVAFGTSLPELVVSCTAAFKGNADIALGNVVGSNVANIGLILGSASLVRTLKVEFTLLRREVPMGLAALLLVVGLGLDGVLGRVDGMILLLGFGCFLYWSVAVERSAPEEVQELYQHAPGGAGQRWRQGLFTFLGLGGVLAGGQFLVDGAVAVAHTLGVPAVIVGLTLVAVGTSLPELAASLVAVARGEDDLSVGNVLGSNLFNLLLVLGVAALLDPITVPPSFLRFQYPVLFGFTLGIFPIMRSGYGICRWEGGLLLGCYGAYVTSLYFLPGLHGG